MSVQDSAESAVVPKMEKSYRLRGKVIINNQEKILQYFLQYLFALVLLVVVGKCNRSQQSLLGQRSLQSYITGVL